MEEQLRRRLEEVKAKLLKGAGGHAAAGAHAAAAGSNAGAAAAADETAALVAHGPVTQVCL